MKIIRNILIGFGGLFLLLIVFFMFIAGSSSEFRTENQYFVTKFMRDFSEKWDINDVKDDLSNQMLAQIDSLNGQFALNYFKSLGKLKSIRNFELNNYRTSTNGETGVFLFKAKFENADTLVTFTLVKTDKGRKVNGLNIQALEDINPIKEVPA